MQQHERERDRERDCIMVYPLQWQAVACRLWGFYGCGKGQEVTQISSDIIFFFRESDFSIFFPSTCRVYFHPLPTVWLHCSLGNMRSAFIHPFPAFAFGLSGTKSISMELQGLHLHRIYLTVLI